MVKSQVSFARLLSSTMTTKLQTTSIAAFLIKKQAYWLSAINISLRRVDSGGFISVQSFVCLDD